MTNKIELSDATGLDLPANRVLRKAVDADLESVVVIGFNVEDDMYFASSIASRAEALWMLEVAKKFLLEISED